MSAGPEAPSGAQIELRCGDMRAVVVEVGAGLRQLTHGTAQIVDGYGEAEIAQAGRGQILLPWPNRVADGRYEFNGRQHQLPLTEPELHGAIHGLTRWVNWRVADRGAHHLRMEYTLHASPGYPFTLALAVEYLLDQDNLTVRTTADNLGTEPCPFGAGAHPYLTAGSELIDSCILTAPGQTWIQTDERLIPTSNAPVDGTEHDFRAGRMIGATQLDAGYTDLLRDADGLARVHLRSERDDRTVTLWQDDSYPYVMLFTGDSDPDPARRRGGLGVEPMTCAPNALQSGDGLIALQPGQQFQGSWGITCSERILSRSL